MVAISQFSELWALGQKTHLTVKQRESLVLGGEKVELIQKIRKESVWVINAIPLVRLVVGEKVI